MNRFCLSLCILAIAWTNLQRVSAQAAGLVFHKRERLYVGGTYVQQGSGNVMHGQMYAERLTPQNVNKPYPIVFLHGKGVTGADFLETPDGRPGWADYFMGQGYEVYLVDGAARGRSIWVQGVDGDLTYGTAESVESAFTATERYNLWPQAKLHTQFVGNGSRGDPVFEQLYASMVPSLVSEEETSRLMKSAGSALLDKIDSDVILLTHSQAGQFGWIFADSRPGKVKAIVALEPSGPPFQQAVSSQAAARPYGLTEIPIEYSPPISSASDLKTVLVSSDASTKYNCYQLAPDSRRTLTNLVDVPVLMLTSESGYHVVYDNCTALYLENAGVNVNHTYLADIGIKGNGHIMTIEKNSLQIAEVAKKWIESTLKL